MTAAPLFPGFDGLMTLSRREGVDIRPTLLRVLTDLYVQASAHSADEERQFVELTSRLIDQVDDATRAAVRARLAIYPATPPEIMNKLGLRRADPGRKVPLAPSIAAALPEAAPVRVPTEAELRMASSLSMRPNDAAEISDMFFTANARERAQILHNLNETPLKASALIPAARARRAIETLEMAAFAEDTDSFAIEIGEALILPTRIAIQVVKDPGGEPLACAARALDMPSAAFQRILMFLSGIRLLGAQCLPAVAALRPADRAFRAGHPRGLARLDHGGGPGQVPPRPLRRRTPARALGTGPDPPRRATGRSRRAANRRAGLRALGSRQIEKMPSCPVLGLDHPGVGIELDFPDQALFH